MKRGRTRLGTALMMTVAWVSACGDATSDLITSPEADKGSAGAVDTASGAIECTSNDDCTGEASLCHPEQNRCTECVTDGHCDELGERCSDELRECAVPCEETDDCPSDDPICDSVIGFCVECREDDDCPAGSACRSSECTE